MSKEIDVQRAHSQNSPGTVRNISGHQLLRMRTRKRIRNSKIHTPYEGVNARQECWEACFAWASYPYTVELESALNVRI